MRAPTRVGAGERGLRAFCPRSWSRRRSSALVGVGLVAAQASPVSVSGFDQNGLEVEVLASFEAGGAMTGGI
jgi:hypothetical protein